VATVLRATTKIKESFGFRYTQTMTNSGDG